MSRLPLSPSRWAVVSLVLLVAPPARSLLAPATGTAATPNAVKPTATPVARPEAGTTTSSSGPGAVERTLQDLARERKLKRGSGGSLTLQVDPNPGAVVQPAGPPDPSEAPSPAAPRARLTVTSASYASPQGDSVPVHVTLASSGPVEACNVKVVATLTADDGSRLGSGEAALERIAKGQTTSLEVLVPVPSGTRVEVRGPSFTLYSGYGVGKKVESASARVGAVGTCP